MILRTRENPVVQYQQFFSIIILNSGRFYRIPNPDILNGL